MVPPNSNRLVPVLVACVLGALVFVVFFSRERPLPPSKPLTAIPVAPPDADTPADTIKTLTANVAAMTADLAALRQDNASLKQENGSLLGSQSQIEQHLKERLDQTFAAKEKAASAVQGDHAGALGSLTARVDALTQSVAALPPEHSGSDIPVGLGLEDAATGQPALTWIEPLDHAALPGTRGALSGLTQGWAVEARNPSDPPHDDRNTREDHATSTPVYTVPRNATLIGATAMTALVGRIPIQGQVRDPMPFKVITGADNLAANGLTVPGVQGMVWSGTAIGDWTLSCVSGHLDSVTFVFDDGTIRTISNDDRNTQGNESNKPLAWISDAQGVPCVSGARKTNAPMFLAERLGVTAIGAAADAVAAAQTTTVVNELGSLNHAVTGNTGPYVFGKTLSGGSDEIAKWLLERQGQSFDAVFVPAGVPIAIHVDRELLIDHVQNGRRLVHASARDADVHTTLD